MEQNKIQYHIVEYSGKNKDFIIVVNRSSLWREVEDKIWIGYNGAYGFWKIIIKEVKIGKSVLATISH